MILKDNFNETMTAHISDKPWLLTFSHNPNHPKTLNTP
jgi:hypothetical protein